VSQRKPVRETSRRRLIADRAARWIVSAGGIAIIVSILGILAFILVEVWPLAMGAHVRFARQVQLPGPAAGALVSDEHRTHVAVLAADGHVRVVRVRDGRLILDTDLGVGELSAMALPPGSRALAGATRDGRVVLAPVSFDVSFDGQTQVVTPSMAEPVILELDPRRRPLEVFAAQLGEDGSATAAAQLSDGILAVVRRSTQENMMTGETTAALERYEAQVPQRLTALVMDADQKSLHGGSAKGEIFSWTLADGQPGAIKAASAGPSAVTVTTSG